MDYKVGDRVLISKKISKSSADALSRCGVTDSMLSYIGKIAIIEKVHTDALSGAVYDINLDNGGCYWDESMFEPIEKEGIITRVMREEFGIEEGDSFEIINNSYSPFSLKDGGIVDCDGTKDVDIFGYICDRKDNGTILVEKFEKVEMSISEIEEKLGITSGTLIIKNEEDDKWIEEPWDN